ncbi:MAG TPA: NADH:flavin oxidoreductase/NADH oxidase [Bacteroidota bacterium]|nr:NADH:flavin oxidoreductase/NADH oxidase [Bacteroidota bacterium]
MSVLFSPLRIRGVEFKNRIGVSPMCQYSSIEGAPTDWHFIHVGSRAIGGAGFIIQEATAISSEGRISPEDAGIWNDVQMAAYKRITDFVHAYQSRIGVQLAHAGRKASTYAPWRGTGEVKKEDGGWDTIAPSPLAFTEGYPHPIEMNKEAIRRVIDAFVSGARRAIEAGYDFIELHMAHGYLVHQYLSPLSNHRSDEYGGSLENRCRFGLEIARAVRNAIGENVPLFARVSATDWVEGGWDCDQTVQFVRMMKDCGIDLIDSSSGGNVATAVVPVGAGYQTEFAARIRREAGVMTAAVGLITAPEQAETIVRTGQADAVLLAREELRDPYWPLHAAKVLRADVAWPSQYLRAK